MTRAFVALGSNLGDRAEHLQAAARALAALPGTRLTAVSRIYETNPVGGPSGQDAYLNAVVEVETALAAEALMARLLEIEHSRGRERRERWGARTLDLDLLLYGERVLHEPHLTVPHPRLAERAFVLVPLADIAPDLVVPASGATVGALLETVDTAGVRPRPDLSLLDA